MHCRRSKHDNPKKFYFSELSLFYNKHSIKSNNLVCFWSKKKRRSNSEYNFWSIQLSLRKLGTFLSRDIVSEHFMLHLKYDLDVVENMYKLFWDLKMMYLGKFVL